MKSILKGMQKNEVDPQNKDIKLQVNNDNPSSRKTKSQKNSPIKDNKSRK